MSPWTDEFRISHPQKGERWIEGRSAPTRSRDGGTVWHGFLTDITERKQVEADQRFLLDLGAATQSATTPAAIARRATQMMGDYFELSRCGITAIDVPGNEANVLHEHTRGECLAPQAGTYPLSMWGSPHWLGVLGAGTIIAVNDTATDGITAPFYETAFRLMNLRAILAVPLRRQGEWVAVLSLGAQRPRDWSGREIDLARAAAERIWPAHDSARALAAERVMHETLAANEERLRLALVSASLGIWERDLIKGDINWDARVREIFGLPAEFEMDADALMSRVHPEDQPAVREKVAASRDPAGNGCFEMECRIHTVDRGSIRHIYSRGLTVFEGEGGERRAVRAIGTLQDITALKQGERALRAANKDLEEFAYVASHDLKAPLRVISNAALWLAQDLAPHLTAETREHIELLHSRVRRMDKLLDDLLEYARVGRDSDEDRGGVVAGDTLIDNVLALLSPVGFTINVSPDFAALRVRRMPLQQIFLNLIGNAIKHHHKKQGCIRVTVEDQGQHYAFAVADDGPGIPARFHEQVFKMFQTLRPRDRVEGSGMGLAMARKNIEVIGGTIQLDSAEGVGSTFRFTWPKRAQRAEKTVLTEKTL
jgi:PAS domain S-box-containing protein